MNSRTDSRVGVTASVWYRLAGICAASLLFGCSPSLPAVTAQPQTPILNQSSTPAVPAGSENQQEPSATLPPLPSATDQAMDVIETETPSTEAAPPLTPTGVERTFAPSSRTALEATDPSSLDLTSGELQFVEFFAFW